MRLIAVAAFVGDIRPMERACFEQASNAFEAKHARDRLRRLANLLVIPCGQVAPTAAQLVAGGRRQPQIATARSVPVRRRSWGPGSRLGTRVVNRLRLEWGGGPV